MEEKELNEVEEYGCDPGWEPEPGRSSQPCGACGKGTVYKNAQAFGPFDRYYCSACGRTWDY